MRLEHINLTVSDLERSIAFYTRLLGIDVRWRGETTGGVPAVHVGGETWYVALFEGAPKPVPMDYDHVDYDHVGYNHVGFVVDNLDVTLARLAELGAEVTLSADYEPGRRVYTVDPDGFEIELVEYTPAT